MTIKASKVEQVSNVDYMITITYDNNTIYKYVGSGTVWHTYPDFVRCTPSTDSLLYNIWSKFRFEERVEKYKKDKYGV